MARFVRSLELPHPPEAVSDWHFRSGAFERLSPPWETVERRSGLGVVEGDTTVLALRMGPLALPWHARHRDVEPGRGFVDEQTKGPFSRFVHQHRFEPGAEGTKLVDDIDVRLPLGLPLFFVQDRLDRMFRYRHKTTEQDLAAHARWSQTPLQFAVTGASGLVGSALVPFLTTGGHTVRTIGRSGGDITWSPDDPSEAEVERLAAALEGTEVIIHLAGESLDGRWSEEKKRRILDSRAQGTALIARAAAAMKTPPKALVCASGVGVYGDTGAAPVDESAPAGEGFLPEVVEAWEAAAQPARDAGVRVVHLRMAPVLTPRGGALEKMLPLFKLGVGGRLGPADAYMPVIGLDDLLDVFLHASVDARLEGPVNAVSHSITYAELADALGEVLRRPSFLPVPSFGLKLVLGAEQAEQMILLSTRAVPAALEAAEHPFRHESVRAMLAHALGKEAP